MDYIALLKQKDWIDIAENYQYKVSGYKAQALFPAMKTPNLKLAYNKIVDGGDLPVMAKVSAFDAEAPIGDRTNFERIELSKLYIKEKINQTEALRYYIKEMAGDGNEQAIKNYIFDDASNLISRVITRTEVMNCELLCTGKITISENNVSETVDYQVPADNFVKFNKWTDVNHDIIGDLQAIIDKASAKGITLVRAITSSKILRYIVNNNKVRAIWESGLNRVPLTMTAMTKWFADLFGIEFIAYDDVYKKSAQDTTEYRFFDENTITFLNTRGTLGNGLYGVTPEEDALTAARKMERMFVTVTQWETPDPVAVWTKASGLYLPAPKNVNKMFIAAVKNL